MFIEMKKEDILKAEQISKWDTVEKAKEFYEKQKGVYTAFLEENPTYAVSTPVTVYKL